MNEDFGNDNHNNVNNHHNLVEHTQTSQNQEVPSVESIKRRIADIASKPLAEHSDEFEAVHADLQRALSGIDGL